MSILLDSHALLWALHDPGRMRPEAVERIRDPGRAVFYSAVSVWELELKAAKGKLTLPGEWLDAVRETGFLEIPVTGSSARASARLPWHHQDPFDRVLVVQAREQDLELATRDTMLKRYGIRILEV